MSNVLCVVAHPDDEVLGCGGTLAKHAEAGDTVCICYGTGRNLGDERSSARRILGISQLYISDLNLPDQKFELESVAYAADFLAATKFEPHIIYTHNPDDLNLDHQFIARAVLTAFRAPRSQADILAFETISSTEFGPTAFQPNHWEVLTWQQMNKKENALLCYPSEVRDSPHPRNGAGVSIHTSFRGQQICQDFAEAFRILRSINA